MPARRPHLCSCTRSALNCSGDWNTEHVWNSNGRGLFCFPIVFSFPKVAKMAAILFCFPMVQTNREQNKLAAILFWTIGKHNFKTYYKVFGIPMCSRFKPPLYSRFYVLGCSCTVISRLSNVRQPQRRDLPLAKCHRYQFNVCTCATLVQITLGSIS